MTQGYVDEMASGPDLTVICGRYGGIDERVWSTLATEAVSLGDFVLSGGEIVAAALADAAIRRLHGVLGNAESLVGESFSAEDMVGPPTYTRPALWDGEEVPGVLLSGDHARSAPGASARRWSVRGRGRPVEGRPSHPEKVHERRRT